MNRPRLIECPDLQRAKISLGCPQESFIVFWDKISLCNHDWPGTHRHLPASTSWMLGLKASDTSLCPNLRPLLYSDLWYIHMNTYCPLMWRVWPVRSHSNTEWSILCSFMKNLIWWVLKLSNHHKHTVYCSVLPCDICRHSLYILIWAVNGSESSPATGLHSSSYIQGATW